MIIRFKRILQVLTAITNVTKSWWNRYYTL